MREDDPAPPPLESSLRPGAGAPEASGAARGPAAPAQAGATHPSPAAGNPSLRPGPSGPAPGDKLRSRPVERPVTIGQLQRILQLRLGFTVSQNTLERWCRECRIRAYRLGAAWRIPRDEIERILRSAELGENL
jgi:excisionase family DNA binding protein